MQYKYCLLFIFSCKLLYQEDCLLLDSYKSKHNIFFLYLNVMMPNEKEFFFFSEYLYYTVLKNPNIRYIVLLL